MNDEIMPAGQLKKHLLSDQMKFIITDTAKQLMNVAKETPSAINYIQSLNPQKVYDVVMSDEAKELFKKGALEFKERSDGLGVMPTLVDKAGQFGKQVALKERLIAPDKIPALNNMVVQQQLAQIINLLEEMNESLNDVLQGQQNDRIALYYSSQQQYIEALSVESPNLKELFLTNAIKTANDSRFQLMETAKYDIRFISKIPISGFGQMVNTTSSKRIASNISKIRFAFKAINDATGICAASYAQLDERHALLTSLEPYRQFIQSNLQVKEGSGETSAFEHLQLYDENADNMWIEKPKAVLGMLDKLQDTCEKLDAGEIIICFPPVENLEE